MRVIILILSFSTPSCWLSALGFQTFQETQSLWPLHQSENTPMTLSLSVNGCTIHILHIPGYPLQRTEYSAHLETWQISAQPLSLLLNSLRTVQCPGSYVKSDSCQSEMDSYLDWLEGLRLTEVKTPGLVFENSQRLWPRVGGRSDLEALDLDHLVEGEREDELLVAVGLEQSGAVLETVLQRVIVIHIETLAPGHVQVGVEGHRRHGNKPARFWSGEKKSHMDQ